jgi:hypothetical protein
MGLGEEPSASKKAKEGLKQLELAGRIRAPDNRPNVGRSPSALFKAGRSAQKPVGMPGVARHILNYG